MDIPDLLLAHGRAHLTNPFILRAAIAATITHYTGQGRTLGIEAQTREALTSLQRSHDALYGICSLHCDQQFRERLSRAPFWRRRKMRRDQGEWTARRWLTLEESARQEIDILIKGVGAPTPTP